LKVNLYFLADIEKKNDRGLTPAADPSFPLIKAQHQSPKCNSEPSAEFFGFYIRRHPTPKQEDRGYLFGGNNDKQFLKI